MCFLSSLLFVRFSPYVYQPPLVHHSCYPPVHLAVRCCSTLLPPWLSTASTSRPVRVPSCSRSHSCLVRTSCISTRLAFPPLGRLGLLRHPRNALFVPFSVAITQPSSQPPSGFRVHPPVCPRIQPNVIHIYTELPSSPAPPPWPARLASLPIPGSMKRHSFRTISKILRIYTYVYV